MSDENLTLIGRLLRQAESTTFSGEREAFMQRAMLLAARHDIDLAVARAHTARKEGREQVEEQTVTIGPAGTRGLGMYVRLFLRISSAYGVKCLIASNSTVVYPMGFPSDIEVTKVMYESLVVQMVAAGDAYVRSGAHRDDVRVRRRGSSVEVRPIHGSTARQQFYAGFAAEVGDRLTAAREEARLQAERDLASRRRTAGVIGVGEGVVPDGSSSVELALVEKQSEVDAFYARRSNGVGRWRGGRSSQRSAIAQEAGREAGRRVDLHQTPRRRLTGRG